MGSLVYLQLTLSMIWRASAIEVIDKLIKSLSSYAWTGSTLLIALLAAIPLFAVLWALTAGDASEATHLWATILPDYALNTLVLMFLVGFLSACIGVSTAWLVTTTNFPAKNTLSWLLVLPLAAPAYIVAYLYTDLLAYAGPIQSWLRDLYGWGPGDYWFPKIRNIPGAALMLSLVLYPYVYLLARAAFAAQSWSQFQAARTLGLTPARAFFRVVLPGARPAIAGGLALVLMETLADFGVADYFAIPTFSTGVFRTWLAMGDKLLAMKLAGIMLILVFLLVGMEVLSRRGQRVSESVAGFTPPALQLTPGQSFLAIIVCAVPILLGFVLPAIVLLQYAVAQGDNQSWTTLWGYAQNSLKVAGVTAVIATLLALFLAYVERATPNQMTRASIRVATLGYALPGTLLAVGLLAPLGAFDQVLTRMSRETFGLDHGLLLTGSIALLVYALVIRFLTVSFNSVSGGMSKISLSMDAAARSLGSTQFGVMRKIHVPLLRPSLAAGATLVFIDVIRELPATLILRPFNFETLATRVYRLASDERLAEASTAALLIMMIGVVPVLALNRLRR